MLDTVLTGGDTPARLIALPGVYRPQSDTRLPADALSREEPGSGTEVLGIGTGTGALALCAAGAGARVTAVDVSWPAVFATRLNALRRRLSLRVLHGDFAARTRGLTADVVSRVTVPWGPVLRSRRAWLLSRGPAEGDEWEELVVIRARRP